ncbi:hypothetical protein DFH09DRAFT_1299290 [Mycena vulgaris]|nr:hypothetical protein DFH09DRAFT_1299290 [Mycena vulgaris]
MLFVCTSLRTLTSSLSVVQLAREVGALWVLPTAFYRISASFRELAGNTFHGAFYNGAPASLSAQDQHSFIDGQANQIRGASDIMAFLCDPSRIAECESPAACAFKRLQVMEFIQSRVSERTSLPLDLWPAPLWQLLPVCPACLAVLKKTHTAARQTFWDNLPTMYALSSWEELKTMKAAAIGNVSL